MVTRERKKSLWEYLFAALFQRRFLDSDQRQPKVNSNQILSTAHLKSFKHKFLIN